MKNDKEKKDFMTCPKCIKEVLAKTKKSAGWGCEAKKVYQCSCGWRSESSRSRK